MESQNKIVNDIFTGLVHGSPFIIPENVSCLEMNDVSDQSVIFLVVSSSNFHVARI